MCSVHSGPTYLLSEQVIWNRKSKTKSRYNHYYYSNIALAAQLTFPQFSEFCQGDPKGLLGSYEDYEEQSTWVFELGQLHAAF